MAEKKTKIEFLQRHLPKVKAGLYRFGVTQTVTVPWAETEHEFKDDDTHDKILEADAENKLGKRIQQTFASERSFSIRGERTVLNPQEVLSVFPPSGSSGDHSNVLPHVILRRSTLPWERANKEHEPWLAVLLFDEDEAPPPQTVTLAELYSGIHLDREPEEHVDEKVTVIDVQTDLLKRIVPIGKELALLAHVRQWKGEGGDDVGSERSVVIANRLPGRGLTSVAHLVSMEGRYESGLFQWSGKATERLVSLKNWRFHCLDEKSFMITESVLKKLKEKRVPEGALRRLLNKEIVREKAFLSQPQVVDALRTKPDAKADLLHAARYKKLGFKSLLLELNRDQLRLPQVKPAIEAPGSGEVYRRRSFVPLPHYLRNGEKTVSWYHGPLISGHNKKAEIGLPARSADELVLLNEANGMYDVSYAAAWKIGRLLMLQSKKASVALYHWKRAHAANSKNLRNQIDHLPFAAMNAPEIPETVRTWLEDLTVLRPVPFNYLVPDERMLPRESLRFFCIDKLWVECLIDGAFSIGRISKHEAERDRAHRTSGAVPRTPFAVVSGILIRSDVVAGWPDLQVDAYAEPHPDLNTEPSTEKLKLLRMERLSANVLICLFGGRGEALTVDIHQRPEGLHFGVSEHASHLGGHSYFKLPRNLETGNELDEPVEVPIDRNPDLPNGTPYRYSRILIQELAESIRLAAGRAKITSADFALQMIEGAQKVRFTTRDA